MKIPFNFIVDVKRSETIKKLLVLIGLIVLFSPALVSAREPNEINDWYIKDFKTEIIVNKDSSLQITEMITADCGNLPNKHGIYRILPTKYYLENGQTVKTSVGLKSITDFDGKPYEYQTIKDNDTITWKIGSANITVQNENNYKITYQVQNTIRFSNANFDEFYWNLNGNFWEIETDSFEARIIFPKEISETTGETNLYTGRYEMKDGGLATLEWNKNILEIKSSRTLAEGEGITASVTVPKNIFTPPPPSFWEKYGAIIQYCFLLIPLFVFIISLLVWSKFGRDPKVSPTIVPEFGIPENLSPLEMGILIKNGGLDNKFISAAIVNLAVKKVLTIKETTSNHYELNLISKCTTDLSESDNVLIAKIFNGKEKIDIDDLKNKFYEDIPEIQKAADKKLKKDDLIPKNGSCAQIIYWTLVVIFFALIFVLGAVNAWLTLSIVLSLIISIIFAIIMPRRTLKGAQLMKKVEGFKLYMKTAERYRQEFNEKENIFEKFLPYAMVFGIVNEWTKSFAKIYEEIHGQDYFATYHPVWFASAVSGQFNPDLFSSNITSLSSHMSSTLASSPSSSGSGGGGFSGGGGGGGGGGGW